MDALLGDVRGVPWEARIQRADALLEQRHTVARCLQLLWDWLANHCAKR
jgi:hypothetical protein